MYLKIKQQILLKIFKNTFGRQPFLYVTASHCENARNLYYYIYNNYYIHKHVHIMNPESIAIILCPPFCWLSTVFYSPFLNLTSVGVILTVH